MIEASPELESKIKDIQAQLEEMETIHEAQLDELTIEQAAEHGEPNENVSWKLELLSRSQLFY